MGAATRADRRADSRREVRAPQRLALPSPLWCAAVLEFVLAFVACALIGVVSALMGLGGGLFMVPLLGLLPEVTWQQAAGTSLACTLATSAAGSVALDKAALADLELVALLEVAAAIGALIAAAFLADLIPERALAAIFALIVSYAVYRMLRRKPAESGEGEESGSPEARNLGWGMLGCSVAGAASGLLGIGGGPIKVPLQTEVCGVPLRVALANSNLMVGITAGVGAAVYFGKGMILASLVAPCALGIGLGAYLGGLAAPKIPVAKLRLAFMVILSVLIGRMVWKALALGS
jgi:uncharacterized membrane protein YfcA